MAHKSITSNEMANDSETRHMAGSAGVSFIVHLMLLVICGFWLLPQPRTPAPSAVDTVWSEDATDEAFVEVSIPAVSEERDSGGSSMGMASLEQLNDEEAATMAFPDLNVSDWSSSESLDPVVLTEAVSVSRGARRRGERGNRGAGFGEGAAEGKNDGGSRFFGAAVKGKRVIYVVDASRSMNHPHPGPMITRFGRVKWELIQSIRQMTPEQEFFIIFFNDRALPMPTSVMPQATPNALETYLPWAAEFRADGFTNPEQALALALELRPDVIYFLTDGEFPARIVGEVAQSNVNRVTINTIGFADKGGEELLRTIAIQNWGDYQFIPANESGQ